MQKKGKTALKIVCWIIGSICFVVVALGFSSYINSSYMSEYVKAFEKVEYSNQLTPQKDEYGNWYFTTDSDFKILHLTDVHLTGGCLFAQGDKKALNAVASMVSYEKPDLVVITGDISFAVPYSGTLNNAYAHGFLISLMEKLGVYWTITLGNHDSENYNYYSRDAVAQMYANPDLKYCLFQEDNGIYGNGNHLINVKNSQGLITKTIFMIDSNAYTADDVFGLGWKYDNVHQDQIDWYESMVNLYSAQNTQIYNALTNKPSPAEKYTTVQSLIFMHIPIQEVKDAYDEFVANDRQDTSSVQYMGGKDGESGQVVYCSDQQEQLFETILTLSSTQAMFFGHDHLNNFVLKYKGVTFSYGYSIDYSAYLGIANQGSQRGCTVIKCAMDTSISIQHENYYQDKYVTVYPKETVSME